MTREPYRLFFPLGIALAWAGVAHWLLHAIGVLEDFRPIFHAMTQIQGFLTAFAVGFLFTMIPRRTESDPPKVWQLAVGVVAPIGISASAWFELWAVSQVFWIVLASVMVGFVVPRFRARRAKRRPPNGFIWIPAAFVIGIAGSLLTAVGAAMGHQHWWLHDLGRTMVLQGVFVSLVIGVSGLAIPLMTRGERPPDATSSESDKRARGLHLLAVLALVASFAIEQILSLRGALFLRAAIILSVMLSSADLLRGPKGPGLNRRLIWTAAWLVPCGYLLAGLVHHHWKAGLHVTFIGGFAMLTLAVSAQVSLGHGGLGAVLTKRPVPLIAMATALLLAIAPRALMDLDPDRYFLWMGSAAALFLLATFAWLALVARALVPSLQGRLRSDGDPKPSAAQSGAR